MPPLGRASGSSAADQLVGGLEAIGRALGEAPHDRGLERVREAGALLSHGIGAWVTWAASVCCGLSPWNGVWPVSIS